MLLMNLIPTNMLSWSALTKWDFNENLAYIVPFMGKMCADFCAMVVIESAVLRYFTKFIWKRVPPINHEFSVIFLIVLNTSICITTAIVTIMSENLQ